jgi:hypothetical protein
LDWPQFLCDRRKALAQVGEQLDLVWPRWDERALAEVDQFVSSDLRRHRASEADLRTHPTVCDLARQTYAAMTELVRDPEDSCVLRTIDGLRAGFDAAAAIFDRPMRDVDEEVRRIRSQAAAEIVRAEAMIADIAAQQRGMGRDSTRPGSGSFRGLRRTGAERSLAHARDLETIRNSLFFNSAHYLEANPDVRAAGIDAAFHFLIHGGREGRDPGPFFSTRAYLARYPDVARAGLNALLHYETQGRRESRIAAAQAVASRQRGPGEGCGMR